MSKINEDIYIDLLLSNSIQETTNQKVALQFYQSSSQSLIRNTTGYKLSIIRFNLNTETLPIFIPTMKNLEGGDLKTTIYSITFEYSGVYYQQYIDFVSQVNNPSDPDEYFYIYNYQYWIYLINQALISGYDNLNGLIELPVNSVAPTMNFDIDTKIASISINDAYYGFNETDKINIYLNLPMYSLFSSLPIQITNINKYGMDYQLNNIMSQDKQILSQEYPTTDLWNPISSIVFTSNLLPTYSSNTPPINIYKNGSLVNGSSSFNFLNILTDFIANDLLFVPTLQYSASVYRFISLKPNQEIKNVDIQVFWIQKNTGQLKKLYLGVGGSGSVKLFFTKE